MRNNSTLRTAVISAAVSALTVAALQGVPLQAAENTKRPARELIREFYAAETAAVVSPHGMRREIEKGTFNSTLVDLRSAEEYQEEHIVGAINIPAYHDRYRSAYDDVERIVNAFRQLPQDKPIIVYCYSGPCMTGRKVGKMLADHDIFVKHLGIGWNEWRHDWKGWNHQHEWDTTKSEDYVVKGKEPGVFKASAASTSGGSCDRGEFSC